MPDRLLINAAGSPGGPAIVELAHRLGLEVVACDIDPSCPAARLADEFFIDSPLSHPDYADILIQAALKRHVRWILPNSGVLELAKVSETKDGIDILCPDEKTVSICEDKGELYASLMADLAPHYWIVDTLAKLDDLLRTQPPGSLCVKPRRSEGSRGFYHLVEKLTEADVMESRTRTRITAREFMERVAVLDSNHILKNVVFAEFLPGREFTVVACIDPTGLVRVLPFERLRPGMDGMSTLNVLHPPSLVEGVFHRILDRLPGLRYYVDIQMMEASDGSLRVIDVNPRISGLIACCTEFEAPSQQESGSDFPQLLPQPAHQPTAVRLFYSAIRVPYPRK